MAEQAGLTWEEFAAQDRLDERCDGSELEGIRRTFQGSQPSDRDIF
jgi:hypothetical protein